MSKYIPIMSGWADPRGFDQISEMLTGFADLARTGTADFDMKNELISYGLDKAPALADFDMKNELVSYGLDKASALADFDMKNELVAGFAAYGLDKAPALADFDMKNELVAGFAAYGLDKASALADFGMKNELVSYGLDKALVAGFASYGLDKVSALVDQHRVESAIFCDLVDRTGFDRRTATRGRRPRAESPTSIHIETVCLLCDRQLVTSTDQRTSAGEIHVRISIMPLCPTCTRRAQQDPDYWMTRLQEMSRPRLTSLPGGGVGDCIPAMRGVLRLVKS